MFARMLTLIGLARMLALFVIRFGFATYVETLAAKSNAARMHH
jgi:hypothetical protein